MTGGAGFHTLSYVMMVQDEKSRMPSRRSLESGAGWGPRGHVNVTGPLTPGYSGRGGWEAKNRGAPGPAWAVGPLGEWPACEQADLDTGKTGRRQSMRRPAGHCEERVLCIGGGRGRGLGGSI